MTYSEVLGRQCSGPYCKSLPGMQWPGLRQGGHRHRRRPEL